MSADEAAPAGSGNVEGPDVVIDAYAVRTFNLSADMHLMPVTDTNTDDWEGGVCIARCRDLTVTHGPVPDDGCHCGIHAA